jgi:hypothetical protein
MQARPRYVPVLRAYRYRLAPVRAGYRYRWPGSPPDPEWYRLTPAHLYRRYGPVAAVRTAPSRVTGLASTGTPPVHPTRARPVAPGRAAIELRNARSIGSVSRRSTGLGGAARTGSPSRRARWGLPCGSARTRHCATAGVGLLVGPGLTRPPGRCAAFTLGVRRGAALVGYPAGRQLGTQPASWVTPRKLVG